MAMYQGCVQYSAVVQYCFIIGPAVISDGIETPCEELLTRIPAGVVFPRDNGRRNP